MFVIIDFRVKKNYYGVSLLKSVKIKIYIHDQILTQKIIVYKKIKGLPDAFMPQNPRKRRLVKGRTKLT